MSLFISLVLLQLVIFGVLMVFLRVVLTRNIAKATSHINEVSQDYAQKLEDAQKRIQEADKYYDEMLLKAKTEAEKTKMQILKDANESQQMIVNQSRKQSEEIIEKAQKSCETLMEEIDTKITEGSIKKACEIIQEILPGLITKEMHYAWVEELSRHGLEELDRLNISSDIREARITSAYDLLPQQKTALEKKIAAKLGHDIQFKIETDPSLISGINITIGSVSIDGSLKFKVKEVARHA